MTDLGVVTLTVHNGVNLAIKDLLSSDPFVKYGMCNQKGEWVGKFQKTKVIPSNVNPVWMESAQFQITPEVCGFRLTCWDHDAVGFNDSMGYAIVNLSDMKLTDVPIEITAVLKPRSDSLQDVVRGHLTLYYTYTTAAYLAEQAELAKKAAEDEADLLVEAPHYEIELEKVKAAASAFTRASRGDGMIDNAQELEDFMDRMQMKDLVYYVLQIERPMNVTDETFESVAASPEFKAERREAMFRIFDANNDGKISWQEVLQTLVTFVDTSNPRLKLELQFEVWDINNDGHLSYDEIYNNMTHAFRVSANMLQEQAPKKFFSTPTPFGGTHHRRGPNISEWTAEETQRFGAACQAAFAQANLGAEFTDALFGHMGKAKDAQISKEEYVNFMMEKGDSIAQLRAAMSMKVLTLIETVKIENRNEKMNHYFSHGVGKFQKDMTVGIMSRAMPAMQNTLPNNQYSKGVAAPNPMMMMAPGQPGMMMPGQPGVMMPQTPMLNHPLLPPGLLDARMQARGGMHMRMGVPGMF